MNIKNAILVTFYLSFPTALFCRDNFIKLHIYYQELNYETIVESPEYQVRFLSSFFLKNEYEVR